MRPPDSKRWALYADHHNILRSDAGRDLHDHPWDFASFILSGSYVEVTRQGSTRFFPLQVNRKRAEDLHRLELDTPVWTLVFTSPYRRQWGFDTARGWVYWRDYRPVAAVTSWHADRAEAGR